MATRARRERRGRSVALLTRADVRFIKSLGPRGERIWADLAHWVVAHRMEGSDRAVAILGASMLEAALESTLLSALAENAGTKNLFGRQGALATLSAKADLAFGMGILSEWEWKNLDRIRRVRNHFAHELRAGSFDEQPINQHCGALLMSEYGRAKGDGEPDPRSAFVTTCGLLAALLSARRLERPNASPYAALRSHVLAPS